MLGGVQYCDPLATQSKFSHPPHKSEQAEQTVKYSHLRKIIQFRYIIHVASYETGIQVTFAELQIIFLESTNISHHFGWTKHIKGLHITRAQGILLFLCKVVGIHSFGHYGWAPQANFGGTCQNREHHRTTKENLGTPEQHTKADCMGTWIGRLVRSTLILSWIMFRAVPWCSVLSGSQPLSNETVIFSSVFAVPPPAICTS